MKKPDKIDREIDVVLPKLSAGKTWFVEYSCYYPRTGKLENFRIYKGFKDLTTNTERNKLAQKLIKEYTIKLKGGWRPWDKVIYLYNDETDYAFLNEHKKCNSSHIHKYLSDFLTETKKKVSPKTYESYQSKTRLFCSWLDRNNYDKLCIYEITNDIVKGFFDYLIQDRKLDRLTIEKYKQNITQMFKYFKSLKLTDIIPTSMVVLPPKLKDMAARPIMDNDLKKLLNYMAKKDPQLLLASLMQFFLCCRPGSELRLLKIQDVDIYNNTVHITEANGKTGMRNITMPNALVDLCVEFKLNEFPPEYYVFSKNGIPGTRYLGKNYLSRKFAQYRDELHLPKIYKFYSFKHTGAGKLLESGATIAEVRNHLGHTSIESTFHYIRRHFGDKSEKVMNFKPDVLKGLF